MTVLTVFQCDQCKAEISGKGGWLNVSAAADPDDREVRGRVEVTFMRSDPVAIPGDYLQFCNWDCLTKHVTKSGVTS